MIGHKGLSRFLEAQAGAYASALAEVRKGRKTGHWMWFIFPQLKGLGHSETAKFYGIGDKEEAIGYLKHPVLGERLIEISRALWELPLDDALPIFGQVDSLKLKSSMTLFAVLDETSPIFQQVLDKFYKGDKDEATIRLLENVT